MNITASPFGKTKGGVPVTLYTLDSGDGMSASVIDYGAALRSLVVPSNRGSVDVVLGYDTIDEYEENGGFMGAVVGRVANRIGKGHFALNGKYYQLGLNDGANHLHGGKTGFFTRMWRAVPRDGALSLLYLSPDGEEGYPGNLACAVTYALKNNSLEISYSALSDADTLCCMSSHGYFNLAGHGDILSHRLAVDAESYCPIDPAGLADGRVLPVENTPFDFRTEKPVGAALSANDGQLRYGGGIDHNFTLIASGFRRAAVLCSKESGIRMEVLTDMPGLQVYTGNSLTERRGKGGVSYAPRSGICLETQFFPDAINHPDMSPPVLRASESWKSRTVYKFDIAD